MRHTPRGHVKNDGIDVSQHLVRRSASLVAALIGALSAISVNGQALRVSNPGDLLTGEPGAFAQALEAARPVPVSAEAKAQILGSLPDDGEVTHLSPRAREKLAT